MNEPVTGELARLPPMARYVFGLLRRPPDAPPITDAQANLLQECHLAHLRSLREDGRLLLSGPLLDYGELRGVLIFRSAGLDEVRHWSADDPAIRAHRLVLELHELYAPAGLTFLPPKARSA